ncbi:hypothetical protein [Methylophilus sp. Leaf408]|uniref:hypothetical protein n=1 Tax=Methylophilus sp. Leaf408 TaxID=2876561 RepID=UPI001E637C9F|nr:hypothetical protein [Methylophilus sp. Leaf408]
MIATLIGEFKKINLIQSTAFILVVFAGGFILYLDYCLDWPSDTIFNLFGILSNFIGTVWIASGAYQFAEDRNHLTKGNPSRSKLVAFLANISLEGSAPIPAGVFYIALGSAAQAFALIGKQLDIFVK